MRGFGFKMGRSLAGPAMASCSDSDVEESQLGRHEHWEDAYSRELKTFKESGDEGEIWFGEDVLKTMVEWTDELLQKKSPDSKGLAVLDIGTGNGSFLLALHARGYTNLTGSDYSEASIALAKAVAVKRGAPDIQWVHDDLLQTKLSERYDVVTDKGTLDAIGLSANSAENRRQYTQAVWQLLQPHGLLIITSCNSTAEELQEELCQTDPDQKFGFLSKVMTYPVFRFGGSEGSRVCTVALEKQNGPDSHTEHKG